VHASVAIAQLAIAFASRAATLLEGVEKVAMNLLPALLAPARGPCWIATVRLFLPDCNHAESHAGSQGHSGGGANIDITSVRNNAEPTSLAARHLPSRRPLS